MMDINSLWEFIQLLWAIEKQQFTVLMKNITFVFLVLFSSLILAQENDIIYFSIVDEYNIPVDTCSATINYINSKTEEFSTTNGQFNLEISKNDTAIISFNRNDHFYKGRSNRFLLPSSQPTNIDNPIKIKLEAQQTIGHGFYQLNFDKAFANPSLLNLPDTISIVDYSKKFLYPKRPFIQLQEIDSNLYTFQFIDPSRKVLVQSAEFNKRLNVRLLENDEVKLTIDKTEKTYYIIGYKTYRGYEWRLTKLK